MAAKKVVVTGFGAVSPFGVGADKAWKGVVEGKSAISLVESVDLSECKAKIGGEVKYAGKSENPFFDPKQELGPKAGRNSRFINFAACAAKEAMLHAGLGEKFSDEDAGDVAVILGSGSGGMDTNSDGIVFCDHKGPARLTPFFIPNLLCNSIAGQVAINHNAKGHSYVTVSACASGNHAIGQSFELIKAGKAKVAITGGSESCYCLAGFAGFASLRALSTKNDTPAIASRPFDKDRDGFVMSEGSCVLILEEYERAKERGATIYAEVLGFGSSTDAFHITAPHPDGIGGVTAMKQAIKEAGINPSDINYVNAHGTSTPVGDKSEILAIKTVFGEHAKSDNFCISSTKSCTGHLLGAAPALEAFFSVKAIHEGVVPPTINLDNPIEEAEGINLVPHKCQKREVNHVLSNALGFGGHNTAVIFGKFKG